MENLNFLLSDLNLLRIISVLKSESILNQIN
jgi:hypothetical protein